MKKITRREFIKVGATGVAALALNQGLSSLVNAQDPTPGGRSVSRTTGTPRHPVPSTCSMCPARCGIIGFLEDNILVKIEGNPQDPNSRGRLCAKGVAGIQYCYNADRLLYPLKRTGARGAGQWQRITWEQAYGELTTRLQAIKASGRPEELVYMGALDEPLVGRLMRAFGTPNALDERALHRANQERASELTWGARTGVNDVANARYILNFGANPYESHPNFVPLVQRLVGARLNGAKLVTFDPRLSNTAGKSDEWFAIQPGTDGLVALAMANVIMQLGLYDGDFLLGWTNYPVEKLAEHLRQYDLDTASAASGIKAGHIRRVAIEFATSLPATAISGGGVSQHANGVQNERAILLLNALVGNIDAKGGYCLPRAYALDEPSPKPPAPAKPSNLAPINQSLRLIRETKQKVGALVTYRHDPVYDHPDSALSATVLKDEGLIPYHVAIASYLTESAALADLILPAATYLESWGLYSMPAYDLVPFVGLQQPVIKPVGESLPMHNICLEMAKRIGGGMESYFKFSSIEAYLRTVVNQVEGLTQAGGLDYLKENGAWRDSAARPTYRAFARPGFKTPSGKLEIYSKQGGETPPLPDYQPIAAHNKLGDEFVLVTFQWNVHSGGLTANCMWLSEIAHDNPVWINKQVAEARGIKHGDRVKVTSASGTITTTAHVTNGIHPRVVAMGGSVGHWEAGRVAKGEPFKSNDPSTRLIWWGEKHGHGVHPYPLIPIGSDPIGGGQAWQDTKVTVSKDSH